MVGAPYVRLHLGQLDSGPWVEGVDRPLRPRNQVEAVEVAGACGSALVVRGAGDFAQLELVNWSQRRSRSTADAEVGWVGPSCHLNCLTEEAGGDLSKASTLRVFSMAELGGR